MGIDQSLTCTGVCVIRQEGFNYTVLHTESIHSHKTNFEDYADTLHRAKFIADRLHMIAVKYKVTHFSIEGLSFGSKGNATRNLAILFATICIKLNIDFPYTVPPTTLKKFATGNGRADKKEMLSVIECHDKYLFNYLNDMTIKAGKYDLADAYWLARYLIDKGEI